MSQEQNILGFNHDRHFLNFFTERLLIFNRLWSKTASPVPVLFQQFGIRVFMMSDGFKKTVFNPIWPVYPQPVSGSGYGGIKDIVVYHVFILISNDKLYGIIFKPVSPNVTRNRKLISVNSTLSPLTTVLNMIKLFK